MTDPLKSLLSKSVAPKPHAMRKAQTLRAAKDALKKGNFEEIALGDQGTAEPIRRKPETNMKKGFLMSRFFSNPQTRQALMMSGVAVFSAAVAFSAARTYFPAQQTAKEGTALYEVALLPEQHPAEIPIDQGHVEPVPVAAMPRDTSLGGSVGNESRVTLSGSITENDQTELVLADRSYETLSLTLSDESLIFDADAPVTFAPLGDVEIGRLSLSPAPVVPRDTGSQPVSTLSIDVNTASYPQVRQSLEQGHWPNPNGVRVEELINYFDYAYEGPQDDVPFATHMTLVPSPWERETQLLHIGIQGKELDMGERPPANLTFLIDTSGSMNRPEKLGLLKRSLTLLLDTLTDQDTVALAAYAGSAGIILPPTEASDRETILAALENLEAGGSTAGAAGIELAYDLASRNFSDGAVNRVILATDGDFNVGVSDPDALERLIEEKRESRVFLSVLTFGQSYGGDQRAQALAQNGNGVAAHIDSLAEARKVLVTEGLSQLVPIAQDVKIQIEFNPANVASYRLIGYETRALAREDFDNDQVDAGEIGAGHSVTAIYELWPTQTGILETGEPLRYAPVLQSDDALADEVAHLQMRYKQPGEETSDLLEWTIGRDEIGELEGEVAFGVAVAAFGELLRNPSTFEGFALDDVQSLAFENLGIDTHGLRVEFLDLIEEAKTHPIGPIHKAVIF